MRLDTRMCIGSVLMVLVCGGSGLYAVSTLSGMLTTLTGPAWDTADGAMEGSIEIEAQMLAVQSIISSGKSDTGRQSLTDARGNADEALNRMTNAGIIADDRIASLTDWRRRYESNLEDVLEKHERQQSTAAGFHSAAAAFVDYTDELEEIADAAVETYSDRPDEQVSWNSGLKESWEAADGAMHARIGMLSQLRYVDLLASGMPVDEFKDEFGKAEAFVKHAMEAMNETRLFDRPTGETGPNGVTVLAHYKQLYTQYETAVADYIEALIQFNESNARYQNEAFTFLGFLAELEEEADGAVESIAAGAIPARTRAWLTIGGSLLASVLASILAGFVLARSITNPLKATVAVLTRIAAGDLTCRVDVQAKGEMGTLVDAVNQITDKFHNTIQKLITSTGTLSGASRIMAETASELAQSANAANSQSTTVASAAEEMSINMSNVSSTTEEVSTNVHRVADSIKEMTQSIGEVARTADASAGIARRASQLAGESNARISELSAATEEISGFVNVIQDIAEQTNLLALNATIESARAGEAGKGFAVVAQEVKELAQQSAKASDDIRQRIESVRATTHIAIGSIGEVSQVIDEVSGTSQTIASAVEQQSITARSVTSTIESIATAANLVAAGISESATASREITRNITGMDAETRRTATGAGNADTASADLSVLAEDLQNLVGQFHV